MTTQIPLLQATGLTKSFDRHTVLHGIDLQVDHGEFLSVMGPSGSGKSTLLYTISGMDTISAGTVSFEGQDLTGMNQKQLARLRLTSMGFIFQHVHLLKNLCLLDNVVLPAYLAGLAPRDELNERALQLMERTGVAELADRDVSEASGGQLQRIGICRALINAPTILFGDEPTGALDSTAATEIMDILAELNADGMTLMLVTHDPRVAARTDRVLYMVDGQIVGDRRQGRHDGTDLDQRQTELSQWLATGERVGLAR
ncbi:ABC transporter ATP-binding protein [Ornithinimicrobium cryptoxanthini]|uniref:ABC transporter ATP-binding protein n=1 Tax=Ornithinimicrobium cryptoxanthini TaxID=2934161 RepID=A0ABY4YH91_9MICO|nr:ABC transporter ATP-binding protein [Ornithinimicrobium cryptoxanthini]USQ75635.1 ABC transporter ATP-binding protein [Ornithinimicrobium cryptoxanthini]